MLSSNGIFCFTSVKVKIMVECGRTLRIENGIWMPSTIR